MKYFTDDLINRFQSEDDEIADAADEEWEQAAEEYLKYINTIKEHMPNEWNDIPYQHDAKIIVVTETEDTFMMIMRMDVPPRGLYMLEYSLIEPVEKVMGAKLEKSSDVYWLYNEITLLDTKPTWQENLRCSNSTELVIKFDKLKITKLPELKFYD